MEHRKGRDALTNNAPGFVEEGIIAYDFGRNRDCGVEGAVTTGDTSGDKPHLESQRRVNGEEVRADLSLTWWSGRCGERWKEGCSK